MTLLSVPTIDVEGPAGRRVTVAPRSGDDRVGELADALGVDPHRPLLLDGRAVGRGDTLARRGRRERQPDRRRRAARRATRHQRRVAAAGGGGRRRHRDRRGRPGGRRRRAPPARAPRRRPVAVGRRRAGRRRPRAAPRAARGRRRRDGALHPARRSGDRPDRRRAGHLAGCRPRRRRAPARAPAGCASAARWPRPPGAAVLTATPGDPWRRTLRRTPRPRLRWEPTPIPVPAAAGPAARPSAVGLLTAATTLLGSAGIAVVMRSPMFLLFGAVGVVASVGMWLAGRIGAARDGRRSGARRARERRRLRRRRRGAAGSSPAAPPRRQPRRRRGGQRRLHTCAATCGARRIDHDDAFRVTLGLGSGRLGRRRRRRRRRTAPAGAGRRRRHRRALRRRRRAGRPRSGRGAGGRRHRRPCRRPFAGRPAGRPGSVPPTGGSSSSPTIRRGGTGARGCPHARPVAVATSWPPTTLDARRRRAVVGSTATDDDTSSSSRTGPTSSPSGPVRCAGSSAPPRPSRSSSRCRPARPSPAMCRSALAIGSHRDRPMVARHRGRQRARGRARGRRVDGHRGHASPACSPGCTTRRIPSTSTTALAAVDRHRCAERTARCRTDRRPDRHRRRRGAPRVPIRRPLARDRADRRRRRRDRPRPRRSPRARRRHDRLGQERAAAHARRLPRGRGRSPDHLTFVLVDYKGGSTFDACAELPHTVGVVTDLDDRLAERALVSLDAELRRRERLLRAAGADDLADVPRRARPRRRCRASSSWSTSSPRWPPSCPTFLPALVGVAQRGRSLGIHLVLATQRPAGVVSDDIRANTNLRIALRLQDPADARDVVGDDEPATFPRGTPGRAMLRLGPGETRRVPVGAQHRARSRRRATTGSASSIDARSSERRRGHRARRARALHPQRRRAVRRRAAAPAVAAAAADDLAPASRPADGAVGLVDVPAEQRRAPRCAGARPTATWRCSAAVGSGTTTALLSLVVAACATPRRRERTSTSSTPAATTGSTSCRRCRTAAASCGPTSGERLRRLLTALGAELDRRRAEPAVAPVRRTSSSPSTACRRCAPLLDAPTRRRAATSRCSGSSPKGPAVGIVCVDDGGAAGRHPAGVLAVVRRALGVPPRRPGRGGRRVACRRRSCPGADPGRLVVASTQAGGAAGRGAAARRARRRPRRTGADRRAAGRSCRPRPCHRRASPPTAMSSSSSASTSSRWRRRCSPCPMASTCSSPGRRAAAAARRCARLATSWRSAHPGGRARRRPGAPVAAGVVAGGRRRGGGRRCRRRGLRPGDRACSSSTTPSGSTIRAARSPRSSPSDGTGVLVRRRRPARRPAHAVRPLDVGRPPEPDRSAAVRRAPTSTATCSASCCRATRRCPPAPGWRGSSAVDGGPSSRSAGTRPAGRCQPAVTAPPTPISFGWRSASRHDNLRPACSTERS